MVRRRYGLSGAWDARHQPATASIQGDHCVTTGYVDFEFDLPQALLARLIKVFDEISAAPLLPSYVNAVPDEQGVYQLFLAAGRTSTLTYIGKTDGEAGLRKRLSRHGTKIQNRLKLDPNGVSFKAVRLYVFTAIDLETQLIKHYGGLSKVSWNGSGFGSNDPGRERDTTTYKPDHFDTQFPIDIGRPLSFPVPMNASAADILRALKTGLPYLVRFELPKRNSPVAHPDLEATIVTIDGSKPLTPETVIAQIVRHLPPGWHATMLPSHVIIYKNDMRKFPSGKLILKSSTGRHRLDRPAFSP